MLFALQVVARGLSLTYALDALRIAIQEPTATASFAVNVVVLGVYSFGFLVAAAFVLQRNLE